MNINLKLSGVAEQTVDEMIKMGYAATKTEAIRMAILDYRHHHIVESAQLSETDLADLKEARSELKLSKTTRIEDI